MTFLRKGIWLSLWQTQNISLLRSSLTTLKCYNIGCHVKFIVSVKYYQQPLSKLARSTNKIEKEKIKTLFVDYFAFQNRYYEHLFLPEMTEEKKEFVLDYLSSGKGCFLKTSKKWSFFLSNNCIHPGNLLWK